MSTKKKGKAESEKRGKQGVNITGKKLSAATGYQLEESARWPLEQTLAQAGSHGECRQQDSPEQLNVDEPSEADSSASRKQTTVWRSGRANECQVRMATMHIVYSLKVKSSNASLWSYSSCCIEHRHLPGAEADQA